MGSFRKHIVMVIGKKPGHITKRTEPNADTILQPDHHKNSIKINYPYQSNR